MTSIFLVVDNYFYPFTQHFVHALQYYYWCIDKIWSSKNYNYIVGMRMDNKTGKEFISNFITKIKEHFPDIQFSKENNLLLLKDEKIPVEIFPRAEYFYKNIEIMTPTINTENKQNKIALRKWFLNPDTPKIIRTKLCGPDKFRETPTIGLINRKKNRKLTNSKDIINNIQKIGFNVEEVFFEDKSFEFQINFFNSHDIIIASHGAALSSIPFMQDYGLVIELANEEWIPYSYFPGLSISSNKSHCIICQNHPFPNFWIGGGIRKKQQKLDIFIEPKEVVACIKDFINHRYKIYEEKAPDKVFIQLR
jgi:hypothetical protein